jgi:hypothetical protein
MPRQEPELLGDLVTAALKKLGITEERFSDLIGRPCNCGKRREYLNRLDLWARRVLSGRTSSARKHLEDIVEDNE